MVWILADKELALKELELQEQAQASTSAAAAPPPNNGDANYPKLPAFTDEKDKLDELLTRYSYTEDGYRKKFREVKERP